VIHPNAPKCDSDPELWFSDSKADKVKAKAICLTCPLLADCREYGKSQEFGIWGGVEATPDGDRVSVAQLDREYRHQQVLALTREGYTAEEIALQMNISARTVTRVRTANSIAA
jgi:WhiB family redox-sensing transcriptional regulator